MSEIVKIKVRLEAYRTTAKRFGILDDPVEDIQYLLDVIDLLENQEMRGIACTLDMIIDKDDLEKWGLEEKDHKRNIQHIFMRLCSAFNEQKKEIEKYKKALEDYMTAVRKWADNAGGAKNAHELNKIADSLKNHVNKTITPKHKKNPVSGLSLKLYRVAGE